MNAQPPQRLVAVLEEYGERKSAPQKEFPWPRDRWLRWFPEYEDLIASFPARVGRQHVRAVAVRPRTTDDALAGFLLAMIWGHGESGYGPWRVRQALDRKPDLPRVLLDTARAAEVDALSGYTFLAKNRAPWLGPAFGTKYLCLCVPQSDTSPLILDRLVSGWLRDRAGVPVNPVPWSTEIYSRYLTLVRGWATELRISPPLVEELIFRDCRGEWAGALS